MEVKTLLMREPKRFALMKNYLLRRYFVFTVYVFLLGAFSIIIVPSYECKKRVKGLKSY